MISKEYKKEMARRHAERTSWGNSAKNYGGADVVGLLDRFTNIKTVLDFGCGKCTLQPYVMERLRRQDVEWREYDPGIPGLDKLPKGRYDMVVTCDVLEHFEPPMVRATLGEIADLTNILSYHNIACSPTGRSFHSGPYNGQDIHLTVQTPSWWVTEIKKAYGDQFELWESRDCLRRAKHNNYRARATIIHERVSGISR